jgi:hypothetical protein
MSTTRKTPSFSGPDTATPEERRWMLRAARVLAECPTTLRLYTSGDLWVSVGHALPEEIRDRVDHRGVETIPLDRALRESLTEIGSLPLSVKIDIL